MNFLLETIRLGLGNLRLHLLRSVLTSRYPSYFEPPPLDDARPNETSWTVFRKHLEDRAP